MSTVVFQQNFAANVDAALKKRDWSQRELARQAGVHWQTINRILSGAMVPSLDICEKISNALELKPEKILKKPA